MKNLYTLVIGILLFGSSTALGGPGHGHSHGPKIGSDKAKVIATQTVGQLVKKGKLDTTWKKTKANEPTKESFGHGPEWVVTVDNPRAKDKKKKRLFVFISTEGEVLGSNFTGK